MAIIRSHPGGRSSSCLRKYRLIFAFGITVLCVQVYLHTFFGLDNDKGKSSRLSSGEGGSSQPEEDEGLPKGLRQLKLPPDKQTNINKQTQLQSQLRNRTAKIKLDRKSLNFTPVCEVTVREAVSAVTRAQNQACKQRIVNVTCLSQQGLLYPERVQSLCSHSPGFTDIPINLGCFKDDKTLRALSGYYHVFKGNNTPERCAYMCLQSGFPYAGTEYSVECFCGMEEPLQTKRLPDSSCNMKCSGNSKQTCGGYLTINIYWTGIQKFKPQEARNSSLKNEIEQPVRIAYLLTVNGRASRQVKRLISILYHPSHLFYIHVDARQDYLYREMLELEKSCKLNNIKVARGEGLRHASIWGGASLLTTFLKSAQQMLAYHQHWDFLVNLSESDFPLKSNNQLIEFLSWNKGMNFAKSHGREVQRFIAKQGLDKTFVECEARMWRIGDRKLPDGIQIDGGSDWFALSRDFVEYVASPNPDQLVSNLLKLFKYTLLPAESFFHTVIRNSRFCNTYIDNNLHMTNWKRKLGCKCQYKAVVDWCGCSPNDFKLEDFNRLRNTADRNIFFARKFEPVIDYRIIDRLEEWLYPDRVNKTIRSRGYDMYWQSLYHHADLSPLPDDALLTLSYSLARLVYRKLNMDHKNIRLLENTAYFRENHFAGILILTESKKELSDVSALPNSRARRVEVLISMRHNFSASRLWSGKIRSLSVSTDYDQKEQTFRNLMGSIGPYSTPVLAYEFDAGITIPQNVSILWIDPHGRLADMNHILLEEMTLVGHVKPQLNEQLAVGTWRLLLVADTQLIAKLKFLVIPLSYWKTKRIDLDKAKEIIDGPSTVYHITEEMNKSWSKLVKSAIVNEQITHSQNRIGEDLDDWLDRLVYEHYEIDEMCDADHEIRSESKLQKCLDTPWSSLSPDSKADTRNLCQNY
ncbi:Xylosyltransferase oxt [Trachymyrmex septentrionalis]|uniref:protein xylosyltransferase n=1 Tax=Trachymyrmex septentrionalis TaxID=34720 RepID=A0A195ET67_9HYME|nr:PREDICTED: xylosyltransferase oxt [Trachymyrmex septentrionalis]KYN31445.1 Xylosyltransferase oxt [Trachymyrmex septentrionalis]